MVYNPGELIVNISVLIGPIIAALVGFFLYRRAASYKISRLSAIMLFLLAIFLSLIICEAIIVLNSHLFSGDSALVIIAAPVTNFMFSFPFALIFFIALAFIKPKAPD